jgi:hypothetical protein
VEPAVNQAVLTDGEKTYLVVYNKSAQLVGAFFTESAIPAAEASLPRLEMTAAAPPGTTTARELVSARRLSISGGKVHFPLPRTQWRVIEFRR